MEDWGESDVFSERDERSVASDSYDEIEFEDLDSLALDKNADKSNNEEGPYSQEPLANDQIMASRISTGKTDYWSKGARVTKADGQGRGTRLDGLYVLLPPHTGLKMGQSTI